MSQPSETPLPVNTGYGPENAPIDEAFQIITEAAPPKARTNGHVVVLV